MPQPTFYIIGAPKCGTSSLRTYLGEHPRVFMSQLKEPGFWADDLPGYRHVSTLEQYLALFDDAGPEHAARGEATATYLYSRTAVPAIRRFSNEARFVVMLRNPVDQAYSYHNQLLYNGHEDEADFRRAWSLQPQRREGRHIPKGCPEPKMLQYGAVASYGEQVERLFEAVRRDRIKIILFRDFAQDTAEVYADVLRFLQLEPDGRTEFPRVNASRRHVLPRIGTWMHNPPAWALRANTLVKRFLGIQRSNIKHLVSVPYRRPALPAAFRRELREYFRPDVQKLQRLIGRDLTHWLA